MVTEMNIHVTTPLLCCLWVSLKKAKLAVEIGYTTQIVRWHLDAAVCIKKREEQLRRTTQIFAHELQSALRLTVEFSNIYLSCKKFVTSA
jgi:hypothetical protein